MSKTSEENMVKYNFEIEWECMFDFNFKINTLATMNMLDGQLKAIIDQHNITDIPLDNCKYIEKTSYLYYSLTGRSLSADFNKKSKLHYLLKFENIKTQANESNETEVETAESSEANETEANETAEVEAAEVETAETNETEAKSEETEAEAEANEETVVF
jgi:uncharacterized membrane protein YqiK